MKVDGAVVATKINKDARSFRKMHMFAGDPWNGAANGIIRNLVVRTTMGKSSSFFRSSLLLRSTYFLRSSLSNRSSSIMRPS